MSDHLRASAVAYDAALASLIGCKGLFTAPLSERKLEMLRERLTEAGESLAACRRLLDRADGDGRFVLGDSNVVALQGRQAS